MPWSRSSIAASASALRAANASAPPTETRLTPAAASSLTGGDARHREHVHRPVDRADDLPDVGQAGQAGGVEHVGPGRLERLQPGDGVGQVRPAVQVVLGPRGQHQPRRPGVRGRRRRPRPARPPARCRRSGSSSWPLKSSTDKPASPVSTASETVCATPSGIVGEAVLQVGRDRQVGRGDDRGRVRQRLVAADRAVRAAQRRREPGAGGGQRLEAERGEQLRATRRPTGSAAAAGDLGGAVRGTGPPSPSGLSWH